VAEYAESWEGVRLRGLRRELGLYLGDAARILGIGVAQMSALERGAGTCDWEVAMRLLREAPVEASRRPTRPDLTPLRLDLLVDSMSDTKGG
jgi:transcriptional regulator with XRE-family HTH domain